MCTDSFIVYRVYLHVCKERFFFLQKLFQSIVNVEMNKLRNFSIRSRAIKDEKLVHLVCLTRRNTRDCVPHKRNGVPLFFLFFSIWWEVELMKQNFNKTYN